MPDFHIPNDPQWQWAYDLILVAVGEEYPKADPTALRAMGDELYALSSTILNGMGATANLGYGLAGSLSGPAMDAFQQYQVGITRNVPAGGNIALALGGSAYNFALDSENTQYNIVIAAFTQVVEIAIALASGFGAAAVPALIKIGQEIVKALIDLFRQRLRHMLMRLAWEAFQEGLEELWQSAAAQVTQIIEGNRKSLDYKDLAIAFAGGAFIGAGVSGVQMIGGKFFPKINDSVLSREGLSALAETLFEGLFTMMVGGGGFNPWATMSSSLIGGMAHHYATVVGNSYGPGAGAKAPPKIETNSLTTTPSAPPPTTSVDGPPVPPPVGSPTGAVGPAGHGAAGNQGAGGRPSDGSGTAGGAVGDPGPGRSGSGSQGSGSQGSSGQGSAGQGSSGQGPGSQGPGQQGAGGQVPPGQGAGQQGAGSPGAGSPGVQAGGGSTTGGQTGAGSATAGGQNGADGPVSNGQGAGRDGTGSQGAGNPAGSGNTAGTGNTAVGTDAPVSTGDGSARGDSTGTAAGSPPIATGAPSAAPATVVTDATTTRGGALAGPDGSTSGGGLPGFDTTTPLASATQPPTASGSPPGAQAGPAAPSTTAPSTTAPSPATPSPATPSAATPAPAAPATGTSSPNSPSAATPAAGRADSTGATPVLPPAREQAGGVSVEVAAVGVPPAAGPAVGIDAPATPAPATAASTPTGPVVTADGPTTGPAVPVDGATTAHAPMDADGTGPRNDLAQAGSHPGPDRTGDPGTTQPVAPAAGTPARATPSPQFQRAKSDAEPKRLRTERYVPWKDTVVPGTHLLRGEITTIDFTTREFTADGRDYRSFDVHLDLVSKNDQMSPQELRDFADAVQRTVDEMVNDRYTLPDGRLLHIDLVVDTPPWRDGMTRDWQADPRRNPPVEVTSETGVRTDQHRWNAGDRLSVMVHEVMHYLGAKEGHQAVDHLFTTRERPGVMGLEVDTLPTSSKQAATSTGPVDYLTAVDLATIHDAALTAGPVRELPIPPAAREQAPDPYPNPQVPSRAPAPPPPPGVPGPPPPPPPAAPGRPPRPAGAPTRNTVPQRADLSAATLPPRQRPVPTAIGRALTDKYEMVHVIDQGSPGLGHQAATVAMLDGLAATGYQGTVVLTYPSNKTPYYAGQLGRQADFDSPVGSYDLFHSEWTGRRGGMDVVMRPQQKPVDPGQGRKQTPADDRRKEQNWKEMQWPGAGGSDLPDWRRKLQPSFRKEAETTAQEVGQGLRLDLVRAETPPPGAVLIVLPAVDAKNDDGSEVPGEKKEEWFQENWERGLRTAHNGNHDVLTLQPFLWDKFPRQFRSTNGTVKNLDEILTGVPTYRGRPPATPPPTAAEVIRANRVPGADALANLVDDPDTDVVLVYYGRTEVTPEHSDVVGRLAAAARPERPTVVLVVGDADRSFTTGNPDVHVAPLPRISPEQMAGLRDRATLVVTEGANTWQESLAAGRPTLSVTASAGDTQPWKHEPAPVAASGSTGGRDRLLAASEYLRLGGDPDTVRGFVRDDDGSVRAYFDRWQQALDHVGSDQVDQALATVTGLPLDPEARQRAEAAPGAPPMDTTARTAGTPPTRLDVPKTRDEIARARHEQRDTAPRRIANTSAYDVIVRDPSPDTRVPDVVARSYERAGLALPPAGRPRLRLDAVDNRIAYDHRVLDLGDRNVQDFTVKVFLDPRDATAESARGDVEARVTEAVDRIYNQGFRIGDRDQLNVTVEFVTRPGEAHAVVALHGTPSPATQTAWSTHSSDLDLAHEIGHFLGLRDEYAVQGRALERALVRDDNSLMATTTPQPGNEPRLLARGVEQIAGLRHDVLSPDRGALPPRTRPSRFEPVRVAGGRNARFDELAGHTRDVNPGTYRQATIDLKNEAAPIGFVVNSMLPAADVDQIPEVVRAVTEGLAPGTRVAFVFGVNTTAEVPDLAFRDAVARAARLAEGLDVPVAVNGYAVGTKNDKFPYGRTRNQVLRDSDTVAAIQGLAQGGPDGADRRYPYVSIQDFDRGARTIADGTHVFDRINRATRFDPEATGSQTDSPARPLMISGGYRVGDAADLVRRTRERLERRARDHEARITELATRDDKDARRELGIERQKLAAVHGGLGKLATRAGQDTFVRDFATAVDEDMRSRDRQATVHPMLPYSPEPNLFVDGLLVLGRPEVRFGDAGAEFLLLAESLHQAYGDELAVAHGAATPADLPPDVLTTDVQVESQNNRHPDRDLGFMTDFVGAATPTDLSRLAADFAAGNFLPQSHAVPTNANRQLFYTEGTGFKEYRAELRKPGIAAGKPFAAPTDVVPRRAGVARAPGEPPRTWQESLTPEQLQQLGAQPHNRLVTTVSLPPPGAGPAPEPSGEVTVDPDLDPSKPARTVGLPTSQRLVAAHLVATSNDSGTIQQEFAAATAIADRGGLSRQPDSLYDAIAAGLPGADANTLRIDTLRAGRDTIVLDDAAAMRQQRPYDNGHFVKAALAPDPGTQRRGTPIDDAERQRTGNAHDVVEFAAARGSRVHLTVHDGAGGPVREYPVRGARPQGRLALVRTIDAWGRVTYAPYVPPPPPASDTGDDSDGSDSESGDFGMFGDVAGLATFAPTATAPAGTATTSATTSGAASPPVAGAVDSGLVFAAPGDRATRSTARDFPDRPDRYHVFGHGETDAIRVGDARITPAQLAARIREDRDRWQGRPIVLIVCDSGTDRSNGFAAQLARELPGTRIIAPGGVVWAGSTGHAIVTGSDSRGPDGEALTPPTGDTRFVEFEASPTDPGRLTVTELSHVLDAYTPVGQVDADRTARSVAQLFAWAQSDVTEVEARTGPALDALTPALDDATRADATHRRAAGLHRDAANRLADLSASQFQLDQRADEAPKLARAGVDAAARAGDTADARRLREIAGRTEEHIRDQDDGVRASLAASAAEVATVRDLRDDAAWAETTAARADEDLRFLRERHDRLAVLRAETRHWADQAARAAADATAALGLPPGPRRDLALADALLRAYPAVNATARRRADLDRITAELAPLGDLPAAVRDRRDAAAQADRLVADVASKAPGASAAHTAALSHMDDAHDSLTESEERLNDVYDLAERLGVPPRTPSPAPAPADAPDATTPQDDADSDLEPPADLLVETGPAGLAPFSPPETRTDETTAGEAAQGEAAAEEIGTALTTEGEVALPSPEAVRRRLPTYLRDSHTLGIAEQLRATRDAALGAALRTLDPRLPADVVAAVEADSRDDIDQFLGAGRPYPVTVGGRPAELVVTAVLDWDRLTVDRLHDDPRKVTTKTRENLTHTLRHNRDRHVEPKVTVTALPGVVVGVGGSVPTAPTTEHSTAHKGTYTSTTTVKVTDLAEVSVPVRFVARLVRPGRPDTGPVRAAGTVALAVPTGLRPVGTTATSAADPALDGPVPARFAVESVRSRPADPGATFFEQVEAILAEDGMADVVRIGAPGRPAVQKLLSDAAFAGTLPTTVVTDPANRHDGWVRSGSLPRGARTGWRRFFPGRSQQVEVRLVARRIEQVESVDGTAHVDTSALAAESSAGATAKRLWGGWATAGPGVDAGPLSLVVAPRVGGSREVGVSRMVTERTGAKQTVTGTAPGIRYRVEYGVQVRVLGREPRMLAGSVEALQWTTRDRLPGTALDPGGREWHGRRGAARTHFAPARIERGESFGGAHLTRFGDRGLYETVAEAVRSVPGHDRFRLATRDEMLRHFDDPRLADGLTPQLQAALSRDADLRTQLSPDQLRHLADRIVGPGLKIPLIRTGTFHDHVTVVTIRGTLRDVSDGDLLDREKIGTDAKQDARSTVTSGRDRSTSAEISLEPRILGPLGQAASAMLGGPRAAVTWSATDESAITGRQAAESSHGPNLDGEGKPTGVRLREFAATLDLTVTARSSVRVNQAGRQLSVGAYGRDVPTVVATSEQRPRTHRLDVRMLVPETRVSRQRPAPDPGPAARDEQTIAYPPPLSRMTGGPHDLDGRRVESFVGAGRLQEAVVDTLHEASGDDIYTVEDGRISTVVADELSPERLTGDAELFSRPLALSNLWHGRRAADARADVRVRLRPTNPVVLDDADEFARIKRTFASGTARKTTHGRSVELSLSATGVATVSGPAADHGGSTGRPAGAVVLSVTPWRRAWGRISERSVSGISKLRVGGRPERELLVRVDVEAEVVAEARHDTNLLPLGLWPASPARRAGRRLTLPGAVVMRMTPTELKRLQDRDRARRHQSADVRLQLRHAENAETVRADQREQRARMARAQAAERGELLRRQHTERRDASDYVDRVRRRRAVGETERRRVDQSFAAQEERHRRELAELTATHDEATRALLQAQERQRAAQAEHQQRERDIVRQEQQRQDEAAADPGTPADREQPAFRPGPQRSFGIGGVTTHVDLTDRIPHLRRALARASSEELAQAILPSGQDRSPFDPVRGLGSSGFLGAAHLHLADALNGGRSEPIRVERRFRGSTYHVTLTAEPVGEPSFTGIELVDEMSVTDRSVVGEAHSRTTSRTAAQVTLTARAQGTETERVEDDATRTTGHGPASGTVAAGLTGTAALGNRATKATERTGRTFEQTLTVSGPVPTYRGAVRLTMTVTGKGLPEDGVSIQTIRDVTTYSATQGRSQAVSGPVTTVPAAQTTDGGRQLWRGATGFDPLPEPGRFAVEDVLVHLPDLHEAARQALVASGVEPGRDVTAALRDTLTVTRMKALPAMLAGAFPLPMPARLGRDLYLDARLVARPKLLRADATVKIGGSAKRSADTEFEQTSGHSFALRTAGPLVVGGVGHPGGASRVGEREAFNAVNAATLVEHQLYRTDPATQVKDEGKVAVSTTGKPTRRTDPDDKLTAAVEYDVEFRFVARSRDAAGKHRGGAEVRVPGGYVVRLDEEAARAVTGRDLSPGLRASALAVADAAKTLSEATARLDGLTSRADADPEEVAGAERAVADAEKTWWDAYHAHETEVTRPPVPVPPAAVPAAAVATPTAQTPLVGDPVDVATGRVIYTEEDARLPGLTLERTHRSDYRWGRCFGPAWASTLDQRVVTDATHARFLAADGSVHTYPLPAEGDEARPVLGPGGPLRRLTGGGWLLTGPDRRLLFAPAAEHGDSWLSDVVTDDVGWHIERAADGTPELLTSTSGVVVVPHLAGGLVVGAHVRAPGDTAAEAVHLPTFGYDDRRHLVEVRNSSGHATRLRYDEAGRLVRWQDRNGEWFGYDYDEAGRCVRAGGAGDWLRYRLRYDDGVTSVTNSLGQVTRYEINERRQVTAIVDPLGATIRQEWDSANRLLSRTDPLGRVTRFDHDARTLTLPDGSTHRVPPRRPAPAGGIEFDALGRVRTTRAPDGAVTTYGWTAEGDLAWRVRPDGSTQRWFYDGEGNLVDVIDASGRAVSFEYGPFDLPTARVDQAGNRTEFTYDTELRLTAVTNPAGRTWRYEYDAAGRLCGQTDFDGRTQRYEHDDAGQLIAHTDAAGTVTHYLWDALGRVVERRVGDAVTRVEYDADGRVAAVTSPDAQVRFTRDAEGRVLSETINGRTVHTSYTDSGAVATRTTPSGRSSRWTFDAAGRPERLTAGEHLLGFTHDDAGREIGRTIGGLVALRQTFDAAGRLTGQHIADAAERRYSYDAADRVTAIADSLAGDQSFTADDTGRIRAVDGDVPQRYDYDEAGNLVGAGGGRWEFTGTMLVRSDDATFSYDAKGRLTGRVDAAGAWRFEWDAEDRLVLAVTPGGDRWRYRYDGFGRRIAKQRLGDGGRVLEEVSFAWSGDLMLEQTHRDVTGATTTTTWDYRPDAAVPVAQTDDGTLRAVITDTIGTPTHLVEPGGGLRWWSRGDLWGRGADRTVTPLAFPGQYVDAETGLHYNRFRYYDPATGRYVSPDPLGLTGGPNPTAYVADPLTVADPLGLTSCTPAPATPHPLATVEPALAAPTDQTPSSLPTNAAPPPPSALYGMPYQLQVRVVDEYGQFLRYETVMRDTPSPPAVSTPAGAVGYHARQWFDDVAPASRTELRNPNSLGSQTYQEIRDEVYPHLGTRPYTGARRDTVGHLNEPLVGGLNYYNTTTTTNRRGVSRTHIGVGDRIAGEADGGQETARQIASYLRGEIELDQIGSAPGREFARIVIFAENARGYESEVSTLPIALDHLANATTTSGTAAQWRTIQSWFPPAAQGFASDEFVPRESRPPVASIMPPQRPDGVTQTGSYYNMVEITDAPPPASSSNAQAGPSRQRDYRSRSPERRGGSSRGRYQYGFQGPQTGTTDVRGAAAPVTDPFRTPLADQLTAAQSDPRAQVRILDSFRDQLSYEYTLDNGSTLRVLAANLHGDTANTGADLATLNAADREHLRWINDHRDAGSVAANVDCVPLTLAVDAYRQTGAVTQVPAQTQPMEIGEVMKRYPGRSVDEVGSIRGLMEALGAMPNGTTAIVGLRPDGPGTVGHVINVSKDGQGRVTFEDAQVPGLATLPAISPDGSVVVIRTSDPAPGSDVDMASVRDSDSDVDMASVRDADSDVDMVSVRDADSDVDMADFSPTTETFAGVAPEAVAKTTAQTPTVGDPIDVTTGRMILTHTDAVLPGLTLERTYRSDYRWGRSFGRAWASTLDQRIIVDGEQVRYLAADGSLLTYPLPAEGEVAQPETGRTLPLRRLVGGGWLLTDPTSGRSLLFAAASRTESLLTDITGGGVRWTIGRDRRGTPTRLLSSTGAVIALTSSAGLITMVSLPNAAGDLMAASQFGYDGDLNLIEVTNSSGDPERFTYADGRLVRWEDRNGEWYTYTYDEAGRCVATDGKGGYLRYRFDYQPGRTVVTDSLGAVRVYELNDRFQVVAETDALGATTRNVWDEAYRLRSTTDPLGRTTSSEYDALGRLVSVTRPDGSRSTTTYDDLGRAVSWTDFDGSTRNRQFGPDGLMVAEVDASGEVVRYEQPAADGQGTTTHVGPTAVVRDPAGQITSVSTGQGETEYVYDALGRLFSMQDDTGLTEFGWTLEGDLAWRENPDGSVEEFRYDGEGNLVEWVDATGRRTIREYGAFDLVTAEIDDEGNRTEYAYDTELRLVRVTNPAGATWSYTYDPNGRMVSETDFDGRTQRYVYDAAGQLVERTDAAGAVTHYAYDLLGRVVERRTGEAVTRFAYDAAGRAVSAEGDDSQVRPERDPVPQR
ncbi:DUF6531 domain-containing protein [Micromonospora sp. TSRI0369]|uniref:DUF6531 domain-containing protein n=1 Tax=Micromonospora sp. TSRI0369 TaxID=1703936 RepID=UPI000ADE748F|nr:DUF6531 domain-containing protein [Micromonospora sp. TSRI0369]